MKHNVFFIILFVISLNVFSQSELSSSYNEVYRAQYHFSPKENRMGNPIAAWKQDSIFHIYFQQNPFNLTDGYYHWGKVSTKDFLHWDDQQLSLSQPEEASDSMEMVPWAGDICKKDELLIAWVNRWNKGIFKTTSEDGINWTEEVKVIGLDSLLQCELDVFWHKQSQKWVMVAFDRPSTTMFIFNSIDGDTWEETSSFNYTFGFPQLFELPVDRKEDDTRWVLATESGTYILGKFDGKVFNLETSVRKFDLSTKVGASLFFPSDDTNQMYMISALKGKQLADLACYGQFSYPVEISLTKFETGVELIQQPAGNLEKIRDGKKYEWQNEKLYPGVSTNIFKRLKGNQLHFKGEIDVVNCDRFSFVLRADRNGQGTEIIYNAKKEEINFLGTQLMYAPIDKVMQFEILVDRSSVELFIDGGRYVARYPISPNPDATKYYLETRGGEILIKNLQVLQLGSVW